MGTPASTERVRAVVGPVVAAAGLVLEDLELIAAGRRTVVRVTIDLADDAVGSLDLDTLASVAREIGAELDASAPVTGEYTLEVSTPGVSRPLTELRHFRRARTRLVRLSLRDGAEVFGRLTSATGAALALSPVDATSGRDVAGVATIIAFADVASAAVEVELSRARAGDADSRRES